MATEININKKEQCTILNSRGEIIGCVAREDFRMLRIIRNITEKGDRVEIRGGPNGNLSIYETKRKLKPL